MKIFDTQRQYHEKKEPSLQKIKMDGHSLVIIGQDFWVGPDAPDQTGYWQRGFYFGE